MRSAQIAIQYHAGRIVEDLRSAAAADLDSGRLWDLLNTAELALGDIEEAMGGVRERIDAHDRQERTASRAVAAAPRGIAQK